VPSWAEAGNPYCDWNSRFIQQPHNLDSRPGEMDMAIEGAASNDMAERVGFCLWCSRKFR
jgi:hypothetical protein